VHASMSENQAIIPSAMKGMKGKDDKKAKAD